MDAGDTCVVVPMFNEHSVIPSVVAGLLTHFPRVICVDDGSNDGSAEAAREAGAEVLVHPINLGQGAALETGIRYALRSSRTRYIVTFDADGQHSAEDAAGMVAAAQAADVQVMLGSRSLGECAGATTQRKVLIRAAAAYSRWTTGLQLTDAHNGLRVFRRDAAEQLHISMPGMSHASEILAQIARRGWSYAEHPTTVTYDDYSRAKGQRGYNALNIVFDLVYHRLRTTP